MDSRTPTDIRPPFTQETALVKVQAAEDAWNSRDPQRVARAYSEDSQWRNRDASQYTAASGSEARTDLMNAEMVS